MITSEKSELFAAVLGLAIIAGFAFWRLLLWIKTAPVRPNPWDEATEAAVQQADAMPVCHHCLTPAPPGQWFCECCGSAVGPYNNLMPYLQAFSEGEVFRNGVLDRMRLSPVTLIGYGLYSVCAFTVFAPIYWYFLLRHWRELSCRDQVTETAPPG